MTLSNVQIFYNGKSIGSEVLSTGNCIACDAQAEIWTGHITFGSLHILAGFCSSECQTNTYSNDHGWFRSWDETRDRLEIRVYEEEQEEKIMQKHTEEDVRNTALGIFARQVDLGQPLLLKETVHRSFQAAEAFYKELESREPNKDMLNNMFERLFTESSLPPISLIKEVRKEMGIGLKEAKDAYETYRDEQSYVWNNKLKKWLKG